jgi:hypothetical protein
LPIPKHLPDLSDHLLPLIYDGQARDFSASSTKGCARLDDRWKLLGMSALICHILDVFAKNNKINRNSIFSLHIFSRMFPETWQLFVP